MRIVLEIVETVTDDRMFEFVDGLLHGGYVITFGEDGIPVYLPVTRAFYDPTGD